MQYEICKKSRSGIYYPVAWSDLLTFAREIAESLAACSGCVVAIRNADTGVIICTY